MYVKYAKILQMSIRCLCRQMNAYNGSKKKYKLQNRILHPFMLFLIVEHVFDLSLLIRLSFIYCLTILLNLIYSFVSFAWTFYKCLSRGVAITQNLPSPQKDWDVSLPFKLHPDSRQHTLLCFRVPEVHPSPAAMVSSLSLLESSLHGLQDSPYLTYSFFNSPFVGNQQSNS